MSSRSNSTSLEGQSTVAYFALVGGADQATFAFNVRAARLKAAEHR